MKSINFLFLALIALSMNISCTGQSQDKEKSTQTPKPEQVQVYYFHYTHRCATCQAVENVSKEAVQELYGNKVSFAAYNLDETDGKTKGKEFDIPGQTLLIVKGDTKINITNEGFMNARSNPGALKQIIKEKIDALML